MAAGICRNNFFEAVICGPANDRMTCSLEETATEIINAFIQNDDPLEDDVEQLMVRDQASIPVWQPGDENNGDGAETRPHVHV